jgi:tetratricopeptide (TPR) repeat protein
MGAPSWPRIILCLTGLAVGSACDRTPPSAREPASAADEVPRTIDADLTATPEATSLLGEPLYPMIRDSAAAARLEAQIDSAEALHEAYPDDAEALIWLGRRYAYAGRYQVAIEVFTEGIQRHPDDARFYRHRGHRYITVRELDNAIQDLEHAARLASGTRDRFEPDGIPNAAGLPRSTTQTNIWYHLGLARYLTGDLGGAAHAFQAGYGISPNDDMRVAMADWLWLSLMRLGREDDADSLLDEISPDMEILENDAYLRRLLVYKGELPSDSLLGDSPTDAEPLAVATHGYGLGAWYLVRGETQRAADVFRRVLQTGYWPAFGYIAAEAELRAMEAGSEGSDGDPASGLSPPGALKPAGAPVVDSM